MDNKTGQFNIMRILSSKFAPGIGFDREIEITMQHMAAQMIERVKAAQEGGRDVRVQIRTEFIITRCMDRAELGDYVHEDDMDVKVEANIDTIFDPVKGRVFHRHPGGYWVFDERLDPGPFLK